MTATQHDPPASVGRPWFRRIVVIGPLVFFFVLLFVVPVSVSVGGSVVGGYLAGKDGDRLRSAARTAHVDPSALLGAPFGKPNALAAALHVDVIDRMQMTSDGWCAEIDVKRFSASRPVFFRTHADGNVTAETAC